MYVVNSSEFIASGYGRSVDNKLTKMWKDSVVDKCHVLSERLSGVIDKNHGKFIL